MRAVFLLTGFFTGVIFLTAIVLLPGVAHPNPQDPVPLELVESFPTETKMDHPAIPDAHDVWLDMIEGATETLEFAEFYASNAPESRLEKVVQAVEDAAGRGVRVRFLAEKRFYDTYPETLDRLQERGVNVRIFDTRDVMGGVHHAKYFIVDDREAFLGSQNFDWRALAHIQEMGVRIRQQEVVAALGDIFEMDWNLAAGGPREASAEHGERTFPIPVVQDGDTLRVRLAASPEDWLPPGIPWDLPLLAEMMDGAQRTLRVQLLTYRTVGRDRTYFETLESALRRAAARGVKVEMLLADWSKRSGTIEGLQSLQSVPGIDVKLVTIPQWSGGFIPYARVIHAKYLVVDAERAWIGTSNWEKDYFFHGRNVGLVIEGSSLSGQLDGYFMDGWESDYAVPVDPCAVYEPPQIGE